MLARVLRLSATAFGTPAQVAARQDDVGSLHGDVRAGPDGDADVGLREGGRVIDAVADERDASPLRLQGGDGGTLAVRQHPGEHGVDAELTRDGVRGARVVAGDMAT